MRRFAVVALALALAPAASCKKDSSKGLPPASDWSAASGGAANPTAPASPQGGGGGAMTNPHAGMGGGGGMANPHGGMGGGGAMTNPHGDNPHAGMGTDPSGGASPQAGPMAQKTAPRTLEKLPDGRAALGPFSIAVPAGWTEKPITSSMRAAQFTLPGAAAGAEAELVVYYFGESGAGSVKDNLDRWMDQFQRPDGKPVKDTAKIEQTKYAGQEASVVSVTGRYVTTSMPGGGDPIDKADQSLVGVIVGSPQGPYYFKLVGPKKTVDVQGPKLRALLGSMKLR
ncbi:MAG TPA: hypothetical protein VNO30_01380 [Kofleriaceae bacterium]|nr:hypothetical protein [Kofleriaceae bacterium]